MLKEPGDRRQRIIRQRAGRLDALTLADWCSQKQEEAVELCARRARRHQADQQPGQQPGQTMPIQKLMPIGAIVLTRNFRASMTSVNVVCRTIASATTVRLAMRPTQT